MEFILGLIVGILTIIAYNRYKLETADKSDDKTPEFLKDD